MLSKQGIKPSKIEQQQDGIREQDHKERRRAERLNMKDRTCKIINYVTVLAHTKGVIMKVRMLALLE